LRAREVVIIKALRFIIGDLWCRSIMIAERIIIEARAWIRKYFNADSVIR